MPPDNSATVAVGGDVQFPEDGPSSGSGLIARTSASAFNLSAVGTYQGMFQVSVTEAGQLVLTLNGTELAYTVVGRATGTSQIAGLCLVQTTATNSVLTVRNPSGNSTALTITPLAGGTDAASAHLVITEIGAGLTGPTGETGPTGATGATGGTEERRVRRDRQAVKAVKAVTAALVALAAMVAPAALAVLVSRWHRRHRGYRRLRRIAGGTPTGM